MKTQPIKMTNFRWTICFMLFMATTINYMDRQVLSLTWKDFIAPEFHWTDTDYGFIAGVFAIVYAAGMLFAGRVIDWMGTRKGYLWTIGIWSLGACLHALCGIATEWWVGVDNVEALKQAEAGSALALSIATISVYFFIAARCILAIGEAGNFPVAAKVAAEYFPKKDRAFPTSIYNSGAAIGALVAPVSIPTLASYFRDLGVGNGWEMAFVIIGALGFVWMGFWVFLYKRPRESRWVNEAELAYIEQNEEEEKTPQASSPTEENLPKMSFLQCTQDVFPAMHPLQTGMGIRRRQIPDRRHLVVLPVLDSRLFERCLPPALQRPDGTIAHLRPLCHHNAIHHRRLAPHLLRGEKRNEPL